MASLETLPQEIYDTVLDSVKPLDLLSLRLVCRELEQKTIDRVATEYFTKHSILLSNEQDLVDAIALASHPSASHPVFGRTLRKLTLFIDRLPRRSQADRYFDQVKYSAVADANGEPLSVMEASWHALYKQQVHYTRSGRLLQHLKSFFESKLFDGMPLQELTIADGVTSRHVVKPRAYRCMYEDRFNRERNDQYPRGPQLCDDGWYHRKAGRCSDAVIAVIQAAASVRQMTAKVINISVSPYTIDMDRYLSDSSLLGHLRSLLQDAEELEFTYSTQREDTSDKTPFAELFTSIQKLRKLKLGAFEMTASSIPGCPCLDELLVKHMPQLRELHLEHYHLGLGTLAHFIAKHDELTLLALKILIKKRPQNDYWINPHAVTLREIGRMRRQNVKQQSMVSELETWYEYR